MRWPIYTKRIAAQYVHSSLEYQGQHIGKLRYTISAQSAGRRTYCHPNVPHSAVRQCPEMEP